MINVIHTVWRNRVSFLLAFTFLLMRTASWSFTALNICDGSVSICEDGDYILYGSCPGNCIGVSTGVYANLIVSNLNAGRFSVSNNSRIDITLLGSNRLSGISLSSNAEMLVVESSEGRLDSHGGSDAGIKGGKITVCRGFVNADCYGYNSNPGISGEVNIFGGTVNCKGGWDGSGLEGNINISGDAIVNASSGGGSGSGIEGGVFNNGSNIVISGRANVTATGGPCKGGAGIGGWRSGRGGNITISSGATVTATGYLGGAGIGGGPYGQGGNVTICSGATVTATGGYLMTGPSNSMGGAGIGGGIYGSGGNVEIYAGANVTATGVAGGAGIGGGYYGSGGVITISCGTIIARSSSAPALEGVINISKQCAIIAGTSGSTAQLVEQYNGQQYAYIASKELHDVVVDNDELSFNVGSIIGYSNLIVEGSDFVTTSNGAWNWHPCSNFTVQSNKQIIIPTDETNRQLIRIIFSK